MTWYPPAAHSSIRATIYGALPDHGQSPVALVLHTTETRGMPGYKHGATAPHYSYDARRRRWHEHADPRTGYVGTMKGHLLGGHGNCKALQVEIIGYSNDVAADSVGGFWVGDFGEEQYQDLAAFVRFARDEFGISDEVTPTPAGGWEYGAASPHRMSPSEWAAFGGLTAHGAVPGNSHWDTGVLNLARISELANEGEERMDTPTWAATLRVADIDQLVKIGVLTPAERDYWAAAVGTQSSSWAEWQDLRNAVDVRLRFWQ